MSDFDSELRGKAYALVGDEITLDAFKQWYRERMANPAAAVFGQATELEAETEPFIPPPRTERFTDYTRDIDEPDEETRAHHKRMLGSGSED